MTLDQRSMIGDDEKIWGLLENITGDITVLAKCAVGTVGLSIEGAVAPILHADDSFHRYAIPP